MADRDDLARGTGAGLVAGGGILGAGASGVYVIEKLLEKLTDANVVPVFAVAVIGVVLLFAVAIMAVASGVALLVHGAPTGGTNLRGARDAPWSLVLVSSLALATAGLIALVLVVIAGGIR